MFMFLLQRIVENTMMARAICIIPANASKIFTACSHVHYQVSSRWLCTYNLKLWNSLLKNKQTNLARFLLTLQQVSKH